MFSQHEARREVLRCAPFLARRPSPHAFLLLSALPVRRRHSRDRLPAHFDIIELVRDHIKHTYDLCLYKRKKIADGWVTATNLLISLSGSRDVKDYASGGDGRKTIDDALGLKVRRPRSVARRRPANAVSLAHFVILLVTVVWLLESFLR